MEQCPLCLSPLEVRLCAPCHDCGGCAQEVTHLLEGLHTYTVYDVKGKSRLTLCNVCAVDIGSYAPAYWGSQSERIQYSDLTLIHTLHGPQPVLDKVCPECRHRKLFLYFVAAVRAGASSGDH